MHNFLFLLILSLKWYENSYCLHCKMLSIRTVYTLIHILVWVCVCVCECDVDSPPFSYRWFIRPLPYSEACHLFICCFYILIAAELQLHLPLLSCLVSLIFLSPLRDSLSIVLLCTFLESLSRSLLRLLDQNSASRSLSPGQLQCVYCHWSHDSRHTVSAHILMLITITSDGFTLGIICDQIESLSLCLVCVPLYILSLAFPYFLGVTGVCIMTSIATCVYRITYTLYNKCITPIHTLTSSHGFISTEPRSFSYATCSDSTPILLFSRSRCSWSLRRLWIRLCSVWQALSYKCIYVPYTKYMLLCNQFRTLSAINWFASQMWIIPAFSLLWQLWVYVEGFALW